jgi:hypothetical protein
MLKNGLTASIFRLDDARVKTIAAAGGKLPEDYRIAPREHKYFYVVMVDVKGTSVGLLYFDMRKNSLAAMRQLEAELERKFVPTINYVWLIAYEKGVYLSSEKIGGLLLKAVKTATPPQILAVLYSK